MDNQKKLTRSCKDKKIGGVCAGVANFFSLDSTIVRVVWALASLIWGFGLLAYIACWIIMPTDEDNDNTTKDAQG